MSVESGKHAAPTELRRRFFGRDYKYVAPNGAVRRGAARACAESHCGDWIDNQLQLVRVAEAAEGLVVAGRLQILDGELEEWIDQWRRVARV